jgi:hypothetical protein
MPNHMDDVYFTPWTSPSFPTFDRIQPTANIANCFATMARPEICRIRVHDVSVPLFESVLSSGIDRRNAA